MLFGVEIVHELAESFLVLVFEVEAHGVRFVVQTGRRRVLVGRDSLHVILFVCSLLEKCQTKAATTKDIRL